MNHWYRLYGKYFFGAISIALIVYVLYSIGLKNVYDVWVTADFSIVLISFIIIAIATIIRIMKFSILLRGKEHKDILEIFTISRMGKEISFAGYFLPLLKRDHRTGGTLQQIVIDRYSEITATLGLAFLASLFIFQRGRLETIIFLVLAVALFVLLILPYVQNPIGGWMKRHSFSLRIHEAIQNLQDKIRITASATIVGIHLLSMLATVLDFVGSYYIFKAYNVDMNLFYIAAIWASSAFISMLAFMIIGSTEISVIYLFNVLTQVTKAVVTSTIILSRLINIIVLAILVVIVSIAGKKRLIRKNVNELAP